MIQKSRAVRYKTAAEMVSWTVVDFDGLPIDDAENYLNSLRARDCSVNTVESYARCLAAYFSWLTARSCDWSEIIFDDLADFIYTFKQGMPPLEKRGGGTRKKSTVTTMAAVLREFYEYHRLENGVDLNDLRLTRNKSASKRTTYHFLAHVEQRSDVETNRLTQGLSDDRETVKVINFEEDFDKILKACHTSRDRLAMSAYYDLGLRIGQALGLRHSDLDVRSNMVSVLRRTDNLNGALSKRRSTFEVKSPARFFSLYREHLISESIPAQIDSDYVFTNLTREPVGRPASYSNMYQQCVAIAGRAGLGHVNPHMLRHSHATALARAGWTSALIAARLGHAHASSADVYIHLASTDLEDQLKATQHLIWPDLPDPAGGHK